MDDSYLNSKREYLTGLREHLSKGHAAELREKHHPKPKAVVPEVQPTADEPTEDVDLSSLDEDTLKRLIGE